LWVALAHTLLGRGDAAHEILSFINPVKRALERDRVKRYRVEPYVVAADIYSAPGHVGRGGWTWYTGAAGWMYRVILENLLGVRREGPWLRIDPCVPSSWASYRITLRLPGAEYVIDVENHGGAGRGVRSLELDGRALEEGRLRVEPGSGRHAVRVVLGVADRDPSSAVTGAHEAAT
jgi:cyclic beta-1,2-glucan synthetase